MNWFYVQNGYRAGPVDGADLLKLMTSRVLTPGTQVWRDGFDDWLPFRDAAKVEPELALGIGCSLCKERHPMDRLEFVGDVLVCAGCRSSAITQAQQELAVQLDAPAQRKKHLTHETTLKSVGLLLLALSVPFVYFGVKWYWAAWTMKPFAIPLGLVPRQWGFVLLPLGLTQFWAGWALIQLRSHGKIPAGIAAAAGLLIFPFGTLISLYFFYAIFSKPGRFILSPQYSKILELTPTIRYRTSPVIWIALAMVMVVGVLRYFEIL